jgi:S-DNA-T family DNA segregation ATPase FtsK/SpoIIIE
MAPRRNTRVTSRPVNRAANRNVKPPLFPPAVTAFFWRRMFQGVGAAFIIAAACIVLALVSYDSGDPSFNTGVGSDRAIGNWIGTPGAYTSDTLLQSLGLASAFLPIVVFCWGIQLWREKEWLSRWQEVLWLIGALTLIACAFAFVPFTWVLGNHLGGSLGALLTNMVKPLAAIAGPTGQVVLATIFAIGGFYTLCRSLGFTRTQWHDFMARRVDWYGAWRERRAERLADIEDEMPLRPAKRHVARVSKADRTMVGAKAAPIKTSARAEKEKQARFAFRDAGDFALPALELLMTPDNKKQNVSESALQKNAELLQSVLEDFSVKGDIQRVNPGPVVTLYEMEPAPGLKSARVINLADDIARSMHATSVRVAVIPGRNAIGIELPNKERETVFLRELLASEEFDDNKGKLPLVLGKDIAGAPIIADLAKMPHLLVAGTTGSGKSVGINAMILSLLYRYTPEQCRLIMIDPKMLELSVYEDIPHLLTPVVTEPKKAVVALKWAVREMEDRYRSMSKMGVRNIEGYNDRIIEARENNEVLSRRVQTGFDSETGKPVFEEQILELKELPYVVVIVDEFADLMLVAGKDVEGCIQRLAQMARAAGIHLIMATQRPSVDVITGTIKANFPSRISYQVTSRIDSRTILNEMGAENLLGRGDLLYMAGGGRITRVHGPFVSDGDVEKIVKHLKAQGEPQYIDDVTNDPEEEGMFGMGGEGSGGDELYQKAIDVVMTEGKASTSFIQRHLKIGYNRAATLIEQMERDGVISAANHVGKREVLINQGRR